MQTAAQCIVRAHCCQNRCGGLYNRCHYSLCSRALKLWLVCVEIKSLTLLRIWGHVASTMSLPDWNFRILSLLSVQRTGSSHPICCTQSKKIHVGACAFYAKPLELNDSYFGHSCWKMPSFLLAHMGKSLQWIWKVKTTENCSLKVDWCLKDVVLLLSCHLHSGCFGQLILMKAI